jgi:hypothetical protein
MKPFIFEFRVIPTAQPLDFSLIEYNESLNLSVDKRTGQPAINQLQMGTETFTRTDEVSDSDRPNAQSLISTETCTKVGGENSDTDAPSVQLLMATETITTSRDEGSDHDIDTGS